MYDHSKRRRWVGRCWSVFERHWKVLFFDCSMCGQCVVRSDGCVCPMRCPKQMRNGPCGGSLEGRCEVKPDRPCIWYMIYQRLGESRFYQFLAQTNLEKHIETIYPSVDWRLWGTSAWLNLFRGRITWKGFAIEPKDSAPKGEG